MLFGRNKKNPIKLADKGAVEWKYTTCGYCSTGCSIEVGLNKDGKAVSARGVGDADVNRGKLCIKGIFEYELFESGGRGQVPLMRERIHEPFRQAGWDESLNKTASEIERIQAQYGRDAFSIVSTGQIMTEEFYTLGKLARGVIGTNNYDGNTTLCMASAVSGYKRSFGSDGPPGCYEDFEHTGCLLAIGSNLPEQHPIIYWRMREAREKRQFPLIVVDPRVTMLAQNADMHLLISPGTDVVLLNSLAYVILEEGLQDEDYIRAHTTDFEAFKATVQDYDPLTASKICGIDEEFFPKQRGLFMTDILPAIETGQIKGLWLIATNPMTSMPNTARIRKTLEKLEFLVVQDAYADVETNEYSHVFLPAAIWVEKEGVFTNTERRVNLIRNVMPPFGESKPDLWIFNEIAQRIERDKKPNFPETTEQVFEEMKELSKGRLLDISGMSYDKIEQQRGLQWPCRDGDETGSKRLYTDGVFQHPGGKAKLIPLPFVDNNERPDDEYPFWLNSGRVVEHFHTRTRTGKLGNQNKFSPTPYMEMNPGAAAHPVAYPVTLFGLIAVQTFALVISTLHLGRPHRFYRAFNNLRYSPVSREVAAVAVFYNLLGVYAVLSGLPQLFGWLPDSLVNGLRDIAGWLAVVAGPASIYFMHRIYRIPARPFWNHWQVLTSFYASMLTLGALVVALVFVPLLAMQGNAYSGLLQTLSVLMLAGLGLEAFGLYRHADYLRHHVGEGQAAWLEQTTTFGKTYWLRNGLMLGAVVLIALAALAGMSGMTGLILWGLAALAVPGAALIGRALFYVLIIPTTMPGAFFWKNPAFQKHAREAGLAGMPQVGVQIVDH